MYKKEITYNEKLNELKLITSHPNNSGRVFVLVEGESDIILYRKLFNFDNCKVECIPGGNPKLEECVVDLVKTYSYVIGIRDSDFINIELTEYKKPNIFLTDYHDIEMTIISEDEVFSMLLMEFSHISINEHSSIRSSIIKTIEKISFLKYLNKIYDLELKFGCGFTDLISFKNLQFDFQTYLSRVMAKSPQAKVTDLDAIVKMLKEIEDSNHFPFQLCNGHDFIKAFCKYATEHGSSILNKSDFVSSAFRMGFSKEMFVRTNLYNETKKWAEINSCTLYE